MRSNERKMSSPKKDNNYDVIDCQSDVKLGFYLYILGDDVFCTLECIESNPTNHTTLAYTISKLNSEHSDLCY